MSHVDRLSRHQLPWSHAAYIFCFVLIERQLAAEITSWNAKDGLTLAHTGLQGAANHIGCTILWGFCVFNMSNIIFNWFILTTSCGVQSKETSRLLFDNSIIMRTQIWKNTSIKVLYSNCYRHKSTYILIKCMWSNADKNTPLHISKSKY